MPFGLAFVVITIVVVVMAFMIPIMLNCKLARSLARGSPKRGNGVSIVDSSGRGGLAFFVPPRL